jgi:1,4-dihydroxy-2-naphthoyl-CoA hydrolase
VDATKRAQIAERGLGRVLGFEYLEMGPELARARMAVSEDVVQPFGIVHGGALAALAESLCSVATHLHVKDEGSLAMGQSNAASFLRPIDSGHVTATARRRHAGRSTWVWDVEMHDDEERLCALVRMTVAVRPAHANG